MLIEKCGYKSDKTAEIPRKPLDVVALRVVTNMIRRQSNDI